MYKKKKINSKKGILFWVTGLPGSGKTAIAKKLKKNISKEFGPTIIISGDDLRKIFKFKKYTKLERLKNGYKFVDFCKFCTNQNLNVIFAAVGLLHKLQSYNKKNIKNYIEIFIKSNLKKILKKGKKKIYKKFKKNIVGFDIKPEFPKNPDIVITNDFSKSIDYLSNKIFQNLKNKYKRKI